MSPDFNKERKGPNNKLSRPAHRRHRYPITPILRSSASKSRRMRISKLPELLIPGSSLIISDYGISSETGPYTDFIVLTH